MTFNPLVLTAGMKGLRYAFALVVPTYCASVTGAIRPIIAGAVVGNDAVLPAKSCPGATVSRFVPRRSISASKPACDDDDRPSTATIAATPIAMPSDDSAARRRRVRRPTLATRARSAGRSPAGVV